MPANAASCWIGCGARGALARGEPDEALAAVRRHHNALVDEIWNEERRLVIATEAALVELFALFHKLGKKPEHRDKKASYTL